MLTCSEDDDCSSAVCQLWVCQLWEECYWCISLQNGVHHVLACTSQSVDYSDWMCDLVSDLVFYCYWAITHILPSHTGLQSFAKFVRIPNLAKETCISKPSQKSCHNSSNIAPFCLIHCSSESQKSPLQSCQATAEGYPLSISVTLYTFIDSSLAYCMHTLGSEYSNDLKSHIHHLALMGFTAGETSIILAIPESTVY